MFVEIHLLQSFAPSNLNRDDTGSPKDCEFGGARRARISSQCLKRAMRMDPSFAAATRVPLGQRTRHLVRELTRRLAETGLPLDQIESVVLQFTNSYASKKGNAKLDKEQRTAVLLFVSQAELSDMTRNLMAQWSALIDAKTAPKATADIISALVKSYSTTTSAPDVALFGRMLADRPELNLEAACQVAHAMSTHRVSMELDYFTAVDDLLPNDQPGAGHINVAGYNSACYYRYARIDWDQLVKNLSDDAELARRAVDGFLQASVRAVPSGKQNSHAALNPPSLALAVVRRDGMAWSLANAFEQPVRSAPEGGYVRASLEALDAYWGSLCQAYGEGALERVAAFRCGAPEAELRHLDARCVTSESAWRSAILSAIRAGEATA
jgi:CRISPR system Cascade subunit CasC